MNFLLLGRGKTGALVGSIAQERGHTVRLVGRSENAAGKALSKEAVKDVDVVIDFTTPEAVIENIEYCIQSKVNLLVGTSGWYQHIPRIREQVEKSGIGFCFGANFSIGVNLFFDIVKVAAPALKQGYQGRMIERHHIHKLDKPSGTAVAINNTIRDASGQSLEIESIREGEYCGDHILEFVSENDVIRLEHSAKSRRGFAAGAVRAAEWLKGKRGFYDFKEIFRQV